MDRDEILNRIRSERARLDEVLSGIPDERLLHRVDATTWTGKDQLAHLTAWHRVTLSRIAGNLPSDEEMDETIDDINERFFERDRETPLEEVRFGFASTFDRLVGAVESMSDADLARECDPRDPEHRTFSQEIAADTFEHYLEHLPAFEVLAEG
jgi:hypothetical protein